MGFWDKVKAAYKKVDKAVGGYLPGGVSPSSSSSSSSTSSSSSSSSSTSSSSSSSSSGGGSSSKSSGSSGGGSSGGGTVTTQTIGPTYADPVIVTDYTTGESVTTKIDAKTGEIKSQTYSSGPSGGGIGESVAISGASRSGGLTSQVSSNIASAQVSSPQSASVEVTAQPNAISAAPANLGYSKPYDIRDDMSFGEKVSYAFGLYTSLDFYRGVAQTATGTGEFQTPKPITAFTQFVSPLNIFGSTKTIGDLPASGEVYQGTGIFNQTTGQFETPKIETGYEMLQREAILNPNVAKSGVQISQDVSSEIIGDLKPRYESEASSLATGYQSRINTGELTLSQAQDLYSTDLSRLQTQYETEATSLYEQRIGPRIDAANAFNQKYSDLIKPVGLSPSTVITGGALIGSSFVGGSEFAGLRSLYRVVSGAVAIEGAGNVAEGLIQKDYFKAGLGAAMFAGGTYAALRSAANEVTIAQIEGATAQRPRIIRGSRNELRPNQFMDQYSYLQKTPTAQAFTRETVFSEYNPSTKGFKILSGSSETTIKTVDYWTGGDIYVGSYRTFTGAGSILPKGSLGVSTNIPGVSIGTESLTPSLSRLTVQTQYSYRFANSLRSNPIVRLGGSSENILGGAESILKNDVIFSKSGPAQYSIKQYTGKGFKAFEDLGGSYAPDTLTILRTNTKGNVYFEPFPNTGLKANPYGGGSQGIVSLQAQSFSGQIFSQNAVKEIASMNAPGLESGSAALPAVGLKQRSQSPGAILAEPQGDIRVQLRSDFAFSAAALEEIQMQQRAMPQMQQVLPGIMNVQVGREMQIQQPQLSQIPELAQQQMPKLMQDQLQVPAAISPAIGAPFNPFISPDIVIPGLPILGGFEAGFPGSGKIPGGKQRMKYTPDFESLIFDIRGKAPEGGAAPNPFAARPIPQGFSFAFSEGPQISDVVGKLPKIPGLRKPKGRRR